MMNTSGAGFVGSVVSGKFKHVSGNHFEFEPKTLLGSAFVVSPEKGLILTCEHVLPEEDRESELDFSFITSDGSDGFQLHEIDKNFCEKWDDKDLIALKLVDKEKLKTFEVHRKQLHHGDKVLAIGIPVDFYKSTESSIHVIARAFTGFIVSTYSYECEMDTQVIKTMSGGPVMVDGEIAGVIYENRKYGLDLHSEEKIVKRSDSGASTVERFTYDEILKLGVFYTSTSFHDWLKGVIEKP